MAVLLKCPTLNTSVVLVVLACSNVTARFEALFDLTERPSTEVVMPSGAFPICKSAKGLVVPMPTLPLFRILMASVAPLFPVWKIMSDPVAPTPEVERSVRVDVVPVPPITNGSVIEVVNVGAVPNTTTPVPVSSVRASRRLADTPVPERAEDASVNMALDAVKLVNVIALDA